jgi:hypothetical protein
MTCGELGHGYVDHSEQVPSYAERHVGEAEHSVVVPWR